MDDRTIEVTFDEITLRPPDRSGEERILDGLLRSELIWSCYVDAPANSEPPPPAASGGIQPLGPLLTAGGQMQDEKLESDFCRANVPAR